METEENIITKRWKRKESMHAYLGQHLIFNSARRDSGGLLSMVILRFELESEAMGWWRE